MLVIVLLYSQTLFPFFLTFFSLQISGCITGHCPHDEKPEEVNSIICEWIMTIGSKVPAERFL